MPQPAVYVLVADGVRSDTLSHAIDAGALPALARMRQEGSFHTLTSCFPSVTGPAYAPFLCGRHPAPAGLPGLRWFDRSRLVCRGRGNSRSYVGHEMRFVDSDLDPGSPTLFELVPGSLGALSVIRRGLARRDQIGASWADAVRTARIHFTGNVAGWLENDRRIARLVARRVREQRPRFVFAALTGVDKTSHQRGHRDQLVLEALGIVDELAATLRRDAESRGEWEDTTIIVVSDHGHSPVRSHEDLAGTIAARGHRVIAHPWVYRGDPDIAVMVSGNAMAHVYVDAGRRDRAWWSALAPHWAGLVDALLERPSVDLVLLPAAPDRCLVVARGRGRAVVAWSGARYSYEMVDGDPLGLGAPLEDLDDADAHQATLASDYPDALAQIAALAGAARSGDIILSASRDWDFRARYEPIPHVSSHGALHREHMLVPLLASRPIDGAPRRTTDVFQIVARLLDLTKVGSRQSGVMEGTERDGGMAVANPVG